jgi:hypothetical protein
MSFPPVKEGIRFPMEMWEGCDTMIVMSGNMVYYAPPKDMCFNNSKELAAYMHKTYRDWKGDLFPILSFLLGMSSYEDTTVEPERS